MSVSDIQQALAKAKADYLAAVDAAKPVSAKLDAASALVRELQGKLIATITEGAKPCPFCKKMPHGIEQPTPKGIEYEIGCLTCKPFDHSDGTLRAVRVRGGMIPRHAVEAWNVGVDIVAKDPKAEKLMSWQRVNRPVKEAPKDEKAK